MPDTEAAFMVLCMREADAVHADVLRAAAEQVQDWQAVVDLAERHRALAYVRRALTRLGLRIDPQAECALGSKLLRLGHAAIVQQQFLRQLSERLQTANVPLLVLKGRCPRRSCIRQQFFGHPLTWTSKCGLPTSMRRLPLWRRPDFASMTSTRDCAA